VALLIIDSTCAADDYKPTHENILKKQRKPTKGIQNPEEIRSRSKKL